MRKRMSGKLKGNVYKVYIDSEGNKYYSLKKAADNGFVVVDGLGDGRTKKSKKPAKKPSK